MSDENTTEDTVADAKDKVEKKFQANFKRLVAVVNGKENLHFPKKVPQDSITELVESLFEEENEACLKDVKEKLRALLKQYAEMEAAFRAKQDEFDKLKKTKKEEFVKAAEALFNKIEAVGDIEKSYYEGLNTALGDKVKDNE